MMVAEDGRTRSRFVSAKEIRLSYLELQIDVAPIASADLCGVLF